ncbi:MAG: polysaccharide deacetylase family protein [Actinomycetota bacterium]|nr:polysaccharide deacetylase family protein [Actinomycetota bacterium]
MRGIVRSGVVVALVVLALGVPVDKILASRFGVCCRMPKVQSAVALTFDDGPDERYTPQILDILAAHQVRATFFVVGEHCERNPALVRRIIAEGHEIANHSQTHGDVSAMDAATLAREFEESQRTLHQLGVEPVWYRPPRGVLNAAQRRLASECGLRVALWSRVVERSRFRSAEEMAATLVGETLAGDILLSHDGRLDRTMTVEALPGLLGGLRAKGLDVVSLSELDARARTRAPGAAGQTP